MREIKRGEEEGPFPGNILRSELSQLSLFIETTTAKRRVEDRLSEGRYKRRSNSRYK